MVMLLIATRVSPVWCDFIAINDDKLVNISVCQVRVGPVKEGGQGQPLKALEPWISASERLIEFGHGRTRPSPRPTRILTAGLCLTFSNRLSRIVIEMEGFRTFCSKRQQNFGRFILDGLGELPNSLDRLHGSRRRRFCPCKPRDGAGFRKRLPGSPTTRRNDAAFIKLINSHLCEISQESICEMEPPSRDCMSPQDQWKTATE